MRSLSALLLLLSSSCASRLLEPIPDLGQPSSPTDDLAMQQSDDASQQDDAALQQDAGVCANHTYSVVPIGNIELVDGHLQTHMAYRLNVTFLGAPCDVPGPIDVNLQPGNATDFLGLTAHLWRSSSTDPACAQTKAKAFTRAVTLDANAPLSNPRLSVRDQSVGNGLAIDFPVTPSDVSTCVCAAVAGSCRQDCDCACGGNGRCIPVGLGSEGVCLEPCAEDVDCGGSLFAGLACGDIGMLVSVCESTIDCHQRGSCPFGQTCAGTGGSAPQCTPPSGDSLGRACSCDSDCAFGAVCASFGHCVIPCATSNDCPNPHQFFCSGEAGCTLPV